MGDNVYFSVKGDFLFFQVVVRVKSGFWVFIALRYGINSFCKRTVVRLEELMMCSVSKAKTTAPSTGRCDFELFEELG